MRNIRNKVRMIKQNWILKVISSQSRNSISVVEMTEDLSDFA